MTQERWQEVKKVLARALERAPGERNAYLDQACAEPDLRREVESLIAAHEQAQSSFLAQPAIQAKELAIGSRLGPYEILSRIGAAVWAMSIGRAIPSSAAAWPSKFFRRHSLTTPSGSPVPARSQNARFAQPFQHRHDPLD